MFFIFYDSLNGELIIIRFLRILDIWEILFKFEWCICILVIINFGIKLKNKLISVVY